MLRFSLFYCWLPSISAQLSELLKALKLKDSVLQSTSHELRNPLHGIIGLSDGLLQGAWGGVTDTQREPLLAVLCSGRRLLTLINDILDAASIRQGKLVVQSAPVDIAEVAQEVARIHQLMARR